MMRQLFPRMTWIVISILAGVALLLPVLHLCFPDGHSLHISSYMLGIVAKFMCYALAALALDLVWGYTGILSLGHGVFLLWVRMHMACT